MNTPPRLLPRFIPTLTEVVHPADLTVEKMTSTPPLESPVVAVQQIGPALDSAVMPELVELVTFLLAEQLPVLRANLQQELEVMVKLAVKEALNSKSSSH